MNGIQGRAGLRTPFSWQSICLAYTKPWAQSLALSRLAGVARVSDPSTRWRWKQNLKLKVTRELNIKFNSRLGYMTPGWGGRAEVVRGLDGKGSTNQMSFSSLPKVEREVSGKNLPWPGPSKDSLVVTSPMRPPLCCCVK